MSDRDYFKRALTFSVFDKIAFSVRRRIFDLFLQYIKPGREESIVDIGVFAGSEDPDQNFLEQFYDYPHRITGVGIEDASFLERQYPGLRFVKVSPGEKLPFKDGQFDVGFSSATIEHVGSREDQRLFLEEGLRVCRRFFLTTPNRFYPIEFHTRLPLLHCLPQPLFRRILKMIGLDFYSEEKNLNLLGKKDLMNLVPTSYRSKASMIPCRLLGVTSNLILVVKK